MRIVFAVLLAAAAVASPAHARHGEDDRRTTQQSVAVSREQALATARTEGVVRVREVKLRDGLWKIEGWTSDARPIEVRIDGTTGAVLKREIYPR